MITLLGSLLGFFGAAFPEILKYFADKRDNAHELATIKMQIEAQQQGHIAKLEEIGAKADIAEATAIYKTYNTGITWVDALNGTVRPVLAYAFFLLYAGLKVAQAGMIDWDAALPWQITSMWNEEDQVIFAGIISFYFGQRAMGKLRK